MINITPGVSRHPLLRTLAAALGLATALALVAGVCSCVAGTTSAPPGAHSAHDALTLELRSKVDTIVVIYAENRAFDNLYGNFPGARGLSEVVDRNGRPLPAYAPQVDRDGTVLSVLPPTWGGVTASGVTPVVTQSQSIGLP